MSQVPRVVFAVCVLTGMATVCLVTHELMWPASSSSRTGVILVPRRHTGLMELLANVTQAVTAMEAQAHKLDAELEHMRQQTRQLLWQRRKDAIWSAIHKCIFLHGCNEESLLSAAQPIKGSNSTISATGENAAARESWNSVYNGSKFSNSRMRAGKGFREIRLSPAQLVNTRLHSVTVFPLHSRKGEADISVHDEFYRQLRPVIYALRATGVFPLSYTSGVARFRLISVAMLYAVLVYAAEMVLLWFTMVRRLGGLMANYNHFSVYLFVLMATAYFMLVICIPIVNWIETRKLARYLQQWTQFEVEYRKVTGRALTLKLRPRVWFLTVLIPVCAFLFELGYQTLGGCLDWAVLAKEVYLDLVRFFLPTFWYLICLALGRTADSIQLLLQTEVRKGRGTVLRYSALWLQLNKLASSTGNTLCYTFGFYLIYMFLTLTLFVYHTMSNLSHGTRLDMILMVVECCFMIYVIFLICDSANSASYKIGTHFLDNLLTIRMATENAELQEQLDMFLQMMQLKQPVVDLGGYAQANRQMLISIGSMLVTYLVVLLQFGMSSDERYAYNIPLEI